MSLRPFVPGRPPGFPPRPARIFVSALQDPDGQIQIIYFVVERKRLDSAMPVPEKKTQDTFENILNQYFAGDLWI